MAQVDCLAKTPWQRLRTVGLGLFTWTCNPPIISIKVHPTFSLWLFSWESPRLPPRACFQGRAVPHHHLEVTYQSKWAMRYRRSPVSSPFQPNPPANHREGTGSRSFSTIQTAMATL